MIRIAAAGDVHFDRDSEGRLRTHFQRLADGADLFLIAGDLTQTGSIEEIRVLADDLRYCPVPVAAVLGNHDYHSDRQTQITEILQDVGVHVLEQSSVVLEVGEYRVGVVGAKGFGGGFLGACCTDFGESEMKAFVRQTKACAARIHEELRKLDTEYRVVLMHYSPIPETLLGEKKEIYPFLGSYYFAEAIDMAGADIIFHGHAHRGVERGTTAGGIPVRNVAQPVIRHVFNIYTLEKDGLLHGERDLSLA